MIHLSYRSFLQCYALKIKWDRIVIFNVASSSFNSLISPNVHCLIIFHFFPEWRIYLLHSWDEREATVSGSSVSQQSFLNCSYNVVMNEIIVSVRSEWVHFYSFKKHIHVLYHNTKIRSTMNNTKWFWRLFIYLFLYVCVIYVQPKAHIFSRDKRSDKKRTFNFISNRFFNETRCVLRINTTLLIFQTKKSADYNSLWLEHIHRHIFLLLLGSASQRQEIAFLRIKKCNLSV